MRLQLRRADVPGGQSGAAGPPALAGG